jgi:hypothetical protein
MFPQEGVPILDTCGHHVEFYISHKNSYKNKFYDKRHVDRNMGEIFALLVCYTEHIGGYLPKLRDNL